MTALRPSLVHHLLINIRKKIEKGRFKGRGGKEGRKGGEGKGVGIKKRRGNIPFFDPTLKKLKPGNRSSRAMAY